jgi:putative PIN family toxin of toxin-antitoxin system
VRVIFDANVLVSALLSRIGAPARLLEAWREGAFELIVCPALLAEVERALAYPKVLTRIERIDAERFIGVLTELAEIVPDPHEPSAVRSSDPGDQYLVALATREQVPLVSGDKHLLALRGQAPVLSPREFLEQIETS